MTNGKRLAFLAAILFLLIGASTSRAQDRSETLFWADPSRAKELKRINQKATSLITEFSSSQYIVREKAVEKFVVWFMDAAANSATRKIIKQELSKIARNEDFELEVRYRSVTVLKILPYIERGEKYRIAMESRELPSGEIIITETLENYCQLIDNFERLLRDPHSVNFSCLTKNGHRIFPFLLEIIENPNNNYTDPHFTSRYVAIRILGKLGGKVSAETLINILRNEKESFFFPT